MLRVPGWSTAEGTPAPDVRKGGSWGPPLTSQHPSPPVEAGCPERQYTCLSAKSQLSHTLHVCVCVRAQIRTGVTRGPLGAAWADRVSGRRGL